MAITKMRIVYDNAADRATNTLSSQAGSLGVENLLTDTKMEVARSVGTSLTITSVWSTAEIIGCVALAFCNLTSTATIRVRGYTESTDVVEAFDTGTVLACRYAPFGLWEWGTVPLGVNAFSDGGGTYGCVWFARASVKKLVVDVIDTDSVEGYIEISRLIAGTYWQPQRDAEMGASVIPEDNTKHYRTDAGDLRIDVGCRYRRLSVNLNALSQTDRANLWRVLRGSGLSRPLFFSLFPESTDPELEQTHQVYGKVSSMSAIVAAYFEAYTSSIEIEEH